MTSLSWVAGWNPKTCFYSEESAITESSGHLTTDQAIAAAVAEIQAKANHGGGLFSQVLVIVDGVFRPDDVNGFRTPVYGSGVGGSDTFLPQDTYPQGTREREDAWLSGKDSEVASLQEAWDWIRDRLPGRDPRPWSVRVVLVGNIGPCDSCRARIANFRAALLELLPIPGVVDVEVVYNQEGKSSSPAVRQGVATTYGYANLTAKTLPNGTSVWRTTIM